MSRSRPTRTARLAAGIVLAGGMALAGASPSSAQPIVGGPLVDIEFETVADPAIEAAILTAFPSHTRRSVDAGDAGALARYVYTHIDLDGDK